MQIMAVITELAHCFTTKILVCNLRGWWAGQAGGGWLVEASSQIKWSEERKNRIIIYHHLLFAFWNLALCRRRGRAEGNLDRTQRNSSISMARWLGLGCQKFVCCFFLICIFNCDFLGTYTLCAPQPYRL